MADLTGCFAALRQRVFGIAPIPTHGAAGAAAHQSLAPAGINPRALSPGAQLADAPSRRQQRRRSPRLRDTPASPTRIHSSALLPARRATGYTT